MDMESSSTSLMKEWQRVPTGHSRWFPVWNQIKSEIWNLVSVLFYPSLRPHKPNCSSEAMRSIDRAWQISRARNAPFPWEFLGNKQIVISLRGGNSQRLNSHYKVMAARRQLPQRSTQFMDGQVGMHAKSSKLFRGCVPPPYGGGTHSWRHRRVCLDQISNSHTKTFWMPSLISELTAIPLCSDGIFSLVTAALNAEHDIQTPRDIQRTVWCSQKN